MSHDLTRTGARRGTAAVTAPGEATCLLASMYHRRQDATWIGDRIVGRPIARMVDIWTVGHSTRTSTEFISLLQGHRIELLADVRRYPGSRRHPQFNAAELSTALGAAGIEYAPMPGLGGRRRPRPDSRNTVWRSESFRGYADYMETVPFNAALGELLNAAVLKRTAIMCAEAVWWQCHRQMIADALKAQGARVLHILDGVKVTEHPYTSAARIVDGRLQYGPPDDSLHPLWEGASRG